MRKLYFRFNLLFLLALLLSDNILYGQSKSYIDDRSGVEIIFNTSESMFPQSWYDSPSNAKIKTIDTDDDINRSLKIIKKALQKYPVNVLKSNLKRFIYSMIFNSTR